MNNRLIIILLTVLLSLQGKTQVTRFHFDDGFRNNILFFDKVNDTLICARNIAGGVEWNLFDANLKLLNRKLITRPLPPAFFQNQLRALNNTLVFINQRYSGGRFEISASKLATTGVEMLDTANIIFSESVSSRSHSDAFSISTSPDRSHVLLARIERSKARDSILLKMITIDHDVNVLMQQDIFVPVKSLTEMLMSVLVDNNGDVEIITGDRYDSYVLGTQLNIIVVESASGEARAGAVKIPRSKLKNMLINNQVPGLLQVYATYSNNIEKEVDGIMNIEINKKQFTHQVFTQEFDRDEKRTLGKILNAAPKEVLNEFNWHTASLSDTSQWLVASVRNVARFPSDFIQKNIMTGTQTSNTTINGMTASGMPQTSGSNTRRTTLNNVTDQIIASAYARPMDNTMNYVRFGDDSLLSLRRNYREIVLAAKRKPETSMEMESMYEKFLYTGSVFPSLCFESAQGPEIIYSIKRKDNYELATSTLQKGTLTPPQLIDQTKYIMIDEYVPMINLHHKIVFFYKNIKTGQSGMMMVE